MKGVGHRLPTKGIGNRLALPHRLPSIGFEIDGNRHWLEIDDNLIIDFNQWQSIISDNEPVYVMCNNNNIIIYINSK